MKPEPKYDYGPINTDPLIEIVGRFYDERKGLAGTLGEGWQYAVVTDNKVKWMKESAVTKLLEEVSK